MILIFVTPSLAARQELGVQPFPGLGPRESWGDVALKFFCPVRRLVELQLASALVTRHPRSRLEVAVPGSPFLEK